MYAFDYQRPVTIAEVERLLLGDADAKLVAGGMSLLPAMKLHLARPSLLIDLAGLDALRGITVGPDRVTIGAMTRHVDVAMSPAIHGAIPSLAETAAGIGDRQVRNRGTIGGSLANSDPAACYPAAVLALDAVIHTNRRTVPADEFFQGLFETALSAGEFIVAIDFPRPVASAYEKFAQPASRFALVGVHVALYGKGSVRVAVTGAASCAFRAGDLERALSADYSEAAAEAVSFAPEGLNTDIHADADYRAALIPVLAARAVKRSLSRTNAATGEGGHE